MTNFTINLVCAILMVLSNTLLKHSLTGSSIKWEGKLIDWICQIILLFKKPIMWCALSVFISANLMWLFILSSQKMNIAYPLQITLVFIISTTFTMYIFGEKLNYSGVLGLIAILGGIFLLIRN